MPLLSSPAMEQLFGILKAKGSLTAEEHDLLISAMRADEAKGTATMPNVSPVPATPAVSATTTSTAALEQRLAKQDAKIKELESNLRGTKSQVSEMAAASAPASLERKLEAQASKVDTLENVISNTKGQIEEMSKVTDNTSPATMSKSDLDLLLADKWYERLKLKGYLQVRGTSILSNDGAELNVTNDGLANDVQSIGIRRGRLTYSGDISNHVYLYSQVDFFGSATGSVSNVLSARDYYADVSLDSAREFRVRLGLSKVPYGWSNLQSSQNRLALERPDAINGAVEGERDIGAFFYWAPYGIRNRYKDLVKMGLRGSGDYGVLALGAYSGNGINRADNNGSTHYVARLAYPFELPNGQFIEFGVQGYTGDFLPTTASFKNPNGAGNITPRLEGGGKKGLTDQRVGISAIIYPQPFGLEAEWNWGQGPVLSKDLRTITSDSLSGGYLQASYRHIFAEQQELIPFIRWQHFDGGRKFATNAPRNDVDEISLGLRYIPYPELEMSLMYTHGSRTNTNVAPYKEANADYIGLQAQINF
ncbi:MAG: porin [Verrucomicrobia bacterium]|nr:porin [Verrucomicrobiota bacterium]